MAADDRIQMSLVRSNRKSRPQGEAKLRGTVNYLFGQDPGKWLTGVPTYGKVRYPGVYPGIDLSYHGKGQRLEFDFELSPGVDPATIRLKFEGARQLTIDSSGSLVISTEHGKMQFERPLIFQPQGGSQKQIEDTGFRIQGRNIVSFRVGSFDRSAPMVIDPVLNYSTYIGASGKVNAIAVDNAGDAFITGFAEGAFPTTPGSLQPNLPAKTGLNIASVFVAKLDPTGTQVIYCTYLGGSANDVANAIAIDAGGNAYVGGGTASPNFPITSGAFQSIDRAPPTTDGFSGEPEGTGFVFKLNSTGTGLLYSTFLGGSADSIVYGLQLNPAGDAYVTGTTGASDFPTTQGVFQTQSKTPYYTGFVTELNSTGSGVVFSTFLGGSTQDVPAAIAIDSQGNSYIAGGTKSTDFPTTAGVVSTVNRALPLYGTAFVTKMNSSGTGLVYSTYLGGSFGEAASAIAVDSAGEAFVTGYTYSTDYPSTPGAFQPDMSSGGEDAVNAFVTKLNSTATGLAYSTFLGGTVTAIGEIPTTGGTGIALDGSENAYISGWTSYFDEPLTPGAFQAQNTASLVSGEFASFIAKFDPTGSKLLYSSFLSGSGDGQDDPACDCATSIALDGSGNVYVAGSATSTDFPTTLGALQNSNPSLSTTDKAFVTQFNASELKSLPSTTITVTSNVNPQMPGVPITFTANVQGQPGVAVPTGNVSFSVPIGPDYPWYMGSWTSVPLDSSGTATYTTSALLDGLNTINAYYLGDENNAPSSGTMTESVANTFTKMSVSSSVNPAPYGQPVTFTATVLDTSGNPVQGTVYFGVGNTLYTFMPLDKNGQGSWPTVVGYPGGIGVGTDTVTVEFVALNPQVEDNQASVVETVNAPTGTTPTPTFTPAAGTYPSAQQVTLTDSAPGANIYYQIGFQPDPLSSPLYTAPIQVSSSETVYAMAILPGNNASGFVSASFVISPPQPDFAISISPSSLTVTPGQSGSTTITVSPVNGFGQQITFSCSGLPAGTTCSFSPTSVTPGSSNATTTLTITASTSAHKDSTHDQPVPAIATLLAVVACFTLRRRRVFTRLNLILVALCAIYGLGGCGGGGNSGNTTPPPPPPTTASVTVTGTAGQIVHTAALTLTVTQ